jgi:hypothetical protein
MDFESLDAASLYVDDVIGDQLPDDSIVYIWNAASNKYDIESKAARGGWTPNSYPIEPGAGIWLEVPSSAASNQYDVYLMGEVPSETNWVVTVPSNLNCVGYTYPVATLWTNTELAKNLPTDSLIYLWDGTNYDIYSKAARGGWSTAADLVIEPGVGFWVDNRGSALDWDIVKPYTWP